MNIIKYSLLLILPLFILSFTPELSAKSHHRNHHHKRATRTSVSLNVNMESRSPIYYQTPTYYNPGYTTVVTQYQQYPQPVYEQVTVVRPYVAPMVVQQVVVQQPPRPTVGLSFFPFFSFWSN